MPPVSKGEHNLLSVWVFDHPSQLSLSIGRVVYLFCHGIEKSGSLKLGSVEGKKTLISRAVDASSFGGEVSVDNNKQYIDISKVQANSLSLIDIIMWHIVQYAKDEMGGGGGTHLMMTTISTQQKT